MEYTEAYIPDTFKNDTNQVIQDSHLNKIGKGIEQAFNLINQLGQELNDLKQVVQVVPTEISAFNNDAKYVTQDTTALENYYTASTTDELLDAKADATHTHDDLIATPYKLGVIKPDDVTTTVDSDGVLSVKGLVTLEYDADTNTLNIKTS